MILFEFDIFHWITARWICFEGKKVQHSVDCTILNVHINYIETFKLTSCQNTPLLYNTNKQNKTRICLSMSGCHLNCLSKLCNDLNVICQMIDLLITRWHWRPSFWILFNGIYLFDSFNLFTVKIINFINHMRWFFVTFLKSIS